MPIRSKFGKTFINNTPAKSIQVIHLEEKLTIGTNFVRSVNHEYASA